MAFKFLRWLYPGIGIKRWAAVITLGFLAAYFSGVLVYGAVTNTEMTMKIRLTAGSIGLVLVAGVLVITGIYRMVKSIERMVGKQLRGESAISTAYERRFLEQGIKVVCLGGGTGMSTLLRGLKTHTANITAVVSVADDGGSSGRLRREFDILPPGDIRKCLIALSDDAPVMAKLLDYRFDEAELSGHSMGNLVLTVLSRITGDFEQAVREANSLFAVRGKVLPATLDRIFLVAHHPDGSTTIGQKNVSRTDKTIDRVELKPNPGPPAKDIIQTLEEADMVILGPGSLYTSVIPTLLTEGIADRLRKSSAVKVYVANIVAYEGETKGFELMDHIRAMEKHGGKGLFDHVLVNDGTVPRAKRVELEDKGARFIMYNRTDIAEDVPYRFTAADIVSKDSPVRHDSERLAQALMDLYAKVSVGMEQ